MKVMVCSTDGSTDFIDAGVLQGDTLEPNLSILYLDYML